MLVILLELLQFFLALFNLLNLKKELPLFCYFQVMEHPECNLFLHWDQIRISFFFLIF